MAGPAAVDSEDDRSRDGDASAARIPRWKSPLSSGEDDCHSDIKKLGMELKSLRSKREVTKYFIFSKMDFCVRML